MTDLRDSALELAGLGWHVFPLRARSKAPLIPGGHGYLDATADRAQIETWWRSYPAANIGLACGASRLIVVDVDPRHGGDDQLHALELRLGPLPSTVRSLTGGTDEGLHVLLKHPGGQVKEGKDALGPGIDLQGDGRYVVMPPSVHPDSGRRYEWEIAPDEQAVADAPEAWVRAMTDASTRPARRVAAGRVESDDPLLDITPALYFEALAGAVPDRRGFVRCPLPDHEDRTPSCRVYELPKTGWFCYGCQRGGTIYDFASLLIGGEHGTALKGAAFTRIGYQLLSFYERRAAA